MVNATTLCPMHLAKMALEALKLNKETVDHAAMGHDMGAMDHAAMGHEMGAMDHGAMGHDMMGGMMMSFHGGYKETILFDFWKTKTLVAFLFSCLALFVCAILYEGLKLAREKLMIYEVKNAKDKSAPSDVENGGPKIRNCHCPKQPDCEESDIVNVTNAHPNCCAANSPNNRDLLINNQDSTNIVYKSARTMLLSRSHLCQTLLHMVQITISYLLMLVFMTYNTWLCLAVVLGAGMGYFIFGVQRVTSIDVNEHCH